MNVGLTQAQVAALAGVSQSTVAKMERGAAGPSLDVRCRVTAACGHELSLRLFPVSTVRLRDSGQLAMAQTIVAAAHASLQPGFEVLTGPGPMHAADILLEGADQLIQIEIERAIVDFQAQRRAAVVKRDSLASKRNQEVRLVLAVPDTATVRARLADHAELIRRALPTTSREVMHALRRGIPIGADGLLFVRPRPSNRDHR